MTALFKSTALLLLLTVGFAAAQSDSASAKPQVVKWEPVAGYDNEFLVYMPQGYATASDGGYITGKPGEGGRVERKITAYRYVNGVVLIMEYYEGDARPVEKSLQSFEKSAGEKLQANGFEVSRYESVKDGYVSRKQYFRLKNRLYVVSTVSRSADDPVVDGFFKSVHLVNGKQIERPNLPANAGSVTLKAITEQTSQASANEPAIDIDMADRKVIVVHAPRPKFPRGELSGSGGKVRLKVLYSASGKVADVAVLESPSKSIAKAAVEAAKGTVFVPAEKDGRLVSAYDVLDYSFSSTMSGFIF